MVDAIGSAVSGLNAAATRIQVSANNTANQNTKSYVPQKVDQVSLSNGGVQAKVNNVTPPTVTAANLSSPKGTQQLPNVNPNREVVNQVVASQAYEANLKTIQVANKALQSLLNIKA